MARTAAPVRLNVDLDRSDYAAMNAALHRLHGAAGRTIDDAVSKLSPGERAKLAVFCYGRTHLHETGLRIAATCDLDALVHASSSTAAGRTLFARSREAPRPSFKPTPGRRAPITLATSASIAFPLPHVRAGEGKPSLRPGATTTDSRQEPGRLRPTDHSGAASARSGL